jgi:hypothetical protein
MKYMLTWTERPQGSPIEYENAQKRILEVFTQWKAPGNFKIELFVIRVGQWGLASVIDPSPIERTLGNSDDAKTTVDQSLDRSAPLAKMACTRFR